MRNLLYALLYFILSSCSQAETQENYPAAIKKYHLERQFDLAKWELYKINSIPQNGSNSDFFISLQSDFMPDSYYIEKRNYEKLGKDIFKDYDRLVKIFGEGKIAKYSDCELGFIHENIDSSGLFNDGEIYLGFIPKFDGYENYPVYKLGGNFCTTIIFVGDEIKHIGCDDFREWDYDVKHYPDSMFYEIIEKRKEDISPWLLNEYERRLKLEK